MTYNWLLLLRFGAWAKQRFEFKFIQCTRIIWLQLLENCEAKNAQLFYVQRVSFFTARAAIYFIPLHRMNEDGEHDCAPMGCSCRPPEGMAHAMGVESKFCPKYFPMILFRNEKLHAGRQKRSALKMEIFNCFSSSAAFFGTKLATDAATLQRPMRMEHELHENRSMIKFVGWKV